jgi:uncharacterized protein
MRAGNSWRVAVAVLAATTALAPPNVWLYGWTVAAFARHHSAFRGGVQGRFKLDDSKRPTILTRTWMVAVTAPNGTETTNRVPKTDRFLNCLTELQHINRQIVSKFAVSDMFAPPSWYSNCHVQTIGGFLLRNSTSLMADRECNIYYVDQSAAVAAIWKLFQSALFGAILRPPSVSSNGKTPYQATFWDNRERIDTPDGDWFHADTKYANRMVPSSSDTQPPLVLLLHGLASSSNSPVSQDLATAIVQQGMDCTCLNFRGCSGQANNQLGGYHLGFTRDVHFYLQRLLAQQAPLNESLPSSSSPPPRRVYLVGFSLGANAVLKCCGELGVEAVTRYGVQGAVALCAPLDQTRNAATLAQPGINRMVYTNNLLQSLQQRSFEQWERFHSDTTLLDDTAANPQLDSRPVDIHRAMAAQTITEFDDAFIAPLYGFDDCWDYYRQTSCIHYLDRIVVPTLIINARDDPFFDDSVWPTIPATISSQPEASMYDGKAPIQMVRSSHGGHLGYFFHQVDSTDPRLVQTDNVPVSWPADQMGRFLRYLESFVQ